MKKFFKNFPLILLMVWPHTSRFFENLIVQLSGNKINEGIVFICGVGIVGLLNIIYAFFYRIEDDDLAVWSLIIKLVHIPYYFTNMISALVLLPAFLFTILVAFGWAVYLILFVICCFYMIASSLYTVRVIRHLKKQDRITKGKATLFTLLCFVPIGDVISTGMVYSISQSTRKIKEEKI